MGLLSKSSHPHQRQKREILHFLFDYAESTGVYLCSIDHTLLEEGPSDLLKFYLFLPAIRTRPF